MVSDEWHINSEGYPQRAMKMKEVQMQNDVSITSPNAVCFANEQQTS